MNEFVFDAATIVLVTIAVINRIKSEAPELKGYWYTVMAVGIGAALYAISLYLPQVVTNFIFIGAAASGIFDIFKKQ
jgi:hypothetical protein